MVSCRAVPETYHLIDRPVLEALGPEGILVNVARGGIVDEAALVEALKRGLIAGAGLDVFEHEPDVPEALLAMENVILQAHVGAFTGEVKQAMAEHAVANLLAHFAGEPLPSRVA